MKAIYKFEPNINKEKLIKLFVFFFKKKLEFQSLISLLKLFYYLINKIACIFLINIEISQINEIKYLIKMEII